MYYRSTFNTCNIRSITLTGRFSVVFLIYVLVSCCNSAK